ncbi:MAG: flavin reductase [Victivallales bacterium]|nr:flavin reductase [Victivallales bacterium]
MNFSKLLNVVLALALAVLCFQLARTRQTNPAASEEAVISASVAAPEVPATHATPKDEAPAATSGELQEFEVTEDFEVNPFHFFMTNGGLILCAGNQEKSNAMTIGWGGLGTLWGRNHAVTVYVAQSRYTRQFMDAAKYFTVMAFGPDRRDVPDYLGHNSGRDGDKAAALGLHTLYTENGTPYYAEAALVLECEMMYARPFDAESMKEVPSRLYSNFPAGVHTMYIGRVVKAWKR